MDRCSLEGLFKFVFKVEGVFVFCGNKCDCCMQGKVWFVKCVFVVDFDALNVNGVAKGWLLGNFACLGAAR
jgi:hypothetical protein